MLWPQWVKYGNLKLTFTDFIDFNPENNPKFTISSKNGSDPDNTFQYLAKPKSNLLVLHQPRLNYRFEIKKQKKTEKLRENSTIFRESEENPDEKSQGLAWNKTNPIEIWTISKSPLLEFKAFWLHVNFKEWCYYQGESVEWKQGNLRIEFVWFEETKEREMLSLPSVQIFLMAEKSC